MADDLSRKNMEPTISVLVGSNFPMLRQSVVALLDNSPNLEIVACAETDCAVLPLVEVHRPQVALLDLEVEWTKLRDVVSGLAKNSVPALLMSDNVDEARACELLQCGVNGIISRRIDPQLLCKSVKAVASGEIWISRTITNLLVRQVRASSLSVTPLETAFVANAVPVSKPSKAELSAANSSINRFNLSPRELEIVQALGEAMTNKDIAAHFGISEYTVKHHLTRIFDKVGVDSRLELMMFATYHGLVGTPEMEMAAR